MKTNLSNNTYSDNNTNPYSSLINKADIPKYISIEGCIGVGKTSLASRLAQSFNSSLLLENVETNPFLKKFYDHPKEVALAAQLSFLLQRVDQLNKLQQRDLFEQQFVSDFLIDKDPLFAQINLSPDEFDLYTKVYASLTFEVPTPDLVIYLQAPTNNILDRIQNRSRSYEKKIDPQYIEKINKAYSEYFYYYDASPLLIINTSQLNLVDNEQDYEQVLNYILKAQTGRHYFNPSFL
jgi:deoxyguanosine kinase